MEESESQSPRRGRGRPSKGSAAKRGSFNTRIREALKRQLEAAAAEAGRSLSEEIEYRLEQSFSAESAAAELQNRLNVMEEKFEKVISERREFELDVKEVTMVLKQNADELDAVIKEIFRKTGIPLKK
jgi:hypothetical protein